MSTLVLEDCTVDLPRRLVRRPDGEAALTTKEAELLAYLIARPDQDVSREQLLKDVWGYRGSASSRTADTTMQRLRAKVEADPKQPRHLLTVHGVGYRFTGPRRSPPPAPGRTNLRDDRGPFVGRAAELAALTERVLLPGTTTLRGPGGTGKTRLARRIGAGVAGTLAGGAWFCDLAESRTAASLVAGVGRVLRLDLGRAKDTDDAIDRVGHGVAARGPCLLILDNLEQVSEQAAPVVARWAELAPRAHLLVTSREPLHIDGEAIVDLSPLPQPDAEALFRARAEASRGAPFGPEDQGAIAEIVRRVDGLPLAVELAAARAAMLRPADILDRLSQRFRLLAGRRRDRPDRHRTLRATLDWSWDLLDEAERTALAQLSTFRGPFSLAAAEEVLLLPEPAWPLDVLQALRDRSLLTDHDDGDPRARLRMLESVREYADERLREDPDEAARAEERHRAATLDHARRLVAAAGGPAPAEALDALEELSADLRAVHTRSIASAKPHAAEAALALDRVLRVRGPIPTRLGLFDPVLDGELPSSELRLRALVARSRARRESGRLVEAGDDAAAAVALGEALNDPGLQGRALLAAGYATEALGRGREAAGQFRAALDRGREAGDEPFAIKAQGALAYRLRELGEPVEAEELVRSALAKAELAGRRAQIAKMLSTLALVLEDRARRDEARAALKRAEELHRELGDRRALAIVLSNQAMTAVSEADMAGAEALFAQACDEVRPLGEPRLAALLLRNLGIARLGLGKTEQAQSDFTGALEVFRRIQDPWNEGRVLSDLGEIAMLRGDPHTAEALYQSAHDLSAEGEDRRYAAISRGNRGLCRHVQGRLDEAEEDASAVTAELVRIGATRPAGYFYAYAGALAADRGQPALARERLAEAESRIRSVDDPKGFKVLAVCRAILDVAEGDPDAASDRLRDADIDPAEGTFDVAIALRLLENARRRR